MKFFKKKDKKDGKFSQQIKKINELLENNQISEALVIIKEVLSQDPKNPNALFCLSQVYREIKQYDKAISILEKLTKENRKRYDIRATLATIYDEIYQLEKAVKEYVELMKDITDDKKSNLNPLLFSTPLAFTAFRLGINDLFLEAMKMIRRVEEQPIFLTKLLAAHKLNQGDIENAIEGYTKLVQMAPEDGSIYYNLGRAYILEKNYKEAEKYLYNAMRLDPKNSETRSYLGYAKLLSGKTSEAQEQLEMALEIKKNDARAWGTKILMVEEEEREKQYKKYMEDVGNINDSKEIEDFHDILREYGLDEYANKIQEKIISTKNEKNTSEEEINKPEALKAYKRIASMLLLKEPHEALTLIEEMTKYRNISSEGRKILSFCEACSKYQMYNYDKTIRILNQIMEYPSYSLYKDEVVSSKIGGVETIFGEVFPSGDEGEEEKEEEEYDKLEMAILLLKMFCEKKTYNNYKARETVSMAKAKFPNHDMTIKFLYSVPISNKHYKILEDKMLFEPIGRLEKMTEEEVIELIE